ncbi:MAG: hypothetical protein SGPRY_010209 [Prymnesium sp.]
MASLELDMRTDSVKSWIRTQQDASGETFGSGGDFDVGMDFDDEKMRKSGRAKNKSVIGVGPRK